MPLILPGNVASATAAAAVVTNSCRFEDGSGAYMHKTPGSEGDRKKWTYSVWIKKATNGIRQHVWTSYYNSSNFCTLNFESDDQLNFYDYNGGSTNGQRHTTRMFRDPSAWYNIVTVWDSENGTTADQLIVYVNGTRESVFDTNTAPSETDSRGPSHTLKHRLGGYEDSNYFFDGYIAEAVFIDGSALAATSFGEFDEDSPTIWKPIDVSGLTFGTHGFYLDFEDSANLGNDANGGTDLTEVNLAAVDQSTDTPVNNFCTWNSIADNLDVTLSEGNTKVVHGTALARRPVISTFGVSAGKWYWEWVAEGSPTAANMEVGIVNYASPFSQGRYLGQSLQDDADFTSYLGNGYINMSGSSSDSGTTYAGGDVVGVAVDMDNTLIYFYKNNTLVNSGGTNFSGMEDGSGFIFMSNGDQSGSASYTAGVNFGGSSGFTISSAAADANGYGNFEFAPPSGFLALCTKNLGSTGG